MPKVKFQFPGSCWNSTICFVHSSPAHFFAHLNCLQPQGSLCSHQPQAQHWHSCWGLKFSLTPLFPCLENTQILQPHLSPPWEQELHPPGCLSWTLLALGSCVAVPRAGDTDSGSQKCPSSLRPGLFSLQENPSQAGMLFLSAETNRDKKKLQGWDTTAAKLADLPTATASCGQTEPKPSTALGELNCELGHTGQEGKDLWVGGKDFSLNETWIFCMVMESALCTSS